MHNQISVLKVLRNPDVINDWLCLRCGQNVADLKESDGNSAVDLILAFGFIFSFLFVSFIVGGLILFGFIVYRAYQLTNQFKSCPCCESSEIIPSNSPLARSYLATHPRC